MKIIDFTIITMSLAI